MKRYLTQLEIDYILDFITINKGIPEKTAISVVNNHKNRLSKQLKKQKVYPETIPELKNIITKYYLTSLIQPGESVGIISAQSIGQKNTQSTLNTFHKAGQAESQVLTGVPRFQELLNATKSPKGPSCKIYFKNGFKSLEEIKEMISYNLVELNINDISENITVILNKEEEIWYKSFNILYSKEKWYRDFSEYKHCISIKIKMDILYKYYLSIKKIVDIIHNSYDDSACVFSPENISLLHIYFDTSDIKLDCKKLLFIEEDNCEEIYLEETVEPIIKKLTISGVNNVKNIYFYQEKDEWIVDTDGSNFIDILLLSFVDNTKTISNNIWEIYETLGIEATKEYLVEEFEKIMEGINVCHINVLVDKMTFNGTISSMSRYTMRKEKIGPIAKSSFEETVDQFLRAGYNGEIDDCKAVSSNIVCGNRPNFGTGMMELKLDINSFK